MTPMRRTVPIAFSALSAALPTVALVSAGAQAATRVAAHNYVGHSVATRYGPVQVTVTVGGHSVTSVGVAAPAKPGRSAQIVAHAVVVLTREALQAQSANVHVVSGATITSRAFEASLASARHAAHLPA